MEVLLIGTGAADGIPNVFCRCATCTDYRARGELRTPTSILVDGRLLVDPGPESPRQVTRFGRDLTGLQAILVGHAHDDHLHPSLLMHRSWVTAAPLRFTGPAPAVAVARAWLDPEQTSVEFSAVTAGDRFELAGYQVLAVLANHEALGEALCYRIDDGSASLLYLTDTGSLPEATMDALAGQRVDLVLLEETFGHAVGKGDQHHNLADFASTVAALREGGVVDAATSVVAIHIGHDNPPLAELRAELGRYGAQALGDGTVLTA